tara:strand:- start:7433 stop:8188 length:756 start_codon:yes stop_codon:yes gene_type:complete
MKKDNLKTIVVYGGTSEIAIACLNEWHKEYDLKVILVGRSSNSLESVALDLQVRYQNSLIETFFLDFNDSNLIEDLNAKIYSSNIVDIALISHGELSDQLISQEDISYTKDQLITNGLSTCIISESLIKNFLKAGNGKLVVIGSVAGDRARKKNYTYGSAKGFVEIYIRGLQHRLWNSNINVSLVKPGPTKTNMTSKLKESAKFADVKKVAKIIVKGVNKNKKTIYAPKKWAFIMLIIRLIPNFIFNRLNI